MISHALTIVVNEMNQHLQDVYQAMSPAVAMGNLSEGVGNGGLLKDRLILSMVNIREESTLKNQPNHSRSQDKIIYQNPPVFLNLQILISATHTDYSNALLMLSRAICFFQHKNVFTPENIFENSININKPSNPLDQLVSFKLIFDLFPLSMDEVNHLWGTLGGKQYPFIMYMMRMIDLQFKSAQSEGSAISQIVINGGIRNEAAKT